MNQELIQIASTSIAALGAISNILGLAVLRKVNLEQSNHIRIIKHLSLTNIFIAIGWVLTDFSSPFHVRFKHLLKAVLTGAVCVWLLMINVLTMDRFLAANFPFTYRTKSSKYRIVIWAVWFIGLIVSLINCWLDQKTWRPIYERFIFLSLDFLFLTLFTITYYTVYCRMQRLTPKSSQSNPSRSKRAVKIVTYILCSFVLFQYVPKISLWTLFVLKKKRGLSVFPFLLLCLRLHLIIDPLLYVLLHSKVYHFVRRLLPKMNRIRPIDASLPV